MERPCNVRKLIERHREALERLGEVCSTVEQTSTKGGRPGRTYWLNKRQCLYLCTKSETARATEVTIQMVEVFDAHLAARIAKPVAVEAHRRALPKRPRRATRPPAAATPTIEREGFAAMRLGGETLLVDLLHLDVAPGSRAVVIGWDAAVAVQDMTEARSNAKFLGDRSFLVPDPANVTTGRRAVFAVGTVVATQPASSPGKGAAPRPRAAKPAGSRCSPLPRRPDLAGLAVCGTA